MPDGGGEDEINDDLEAWGAPESVKEAVRSRAEQETEIRVLSENWDTVFVWFRVCRYWVIDGFSGVHRYIDLNQVRQIMESMGKWPNDSLLADIQFMESSARRVINDRLSGK